MEPTNPPQQPNPQPVPPPVDPAPLPSPQRPATDPKPEPAPSPPVAPNSQPAQASPGNEIPSAFSLFKPSWEALKLNLATFISLWIVPVVLYILLFAVGFKSSTTHTSSGSFSKSGTLSGAGLALFGLIFLVYLVIGPALTVAFVKSAQGQKIGVGAAIKQGLSFLPRLLGLGICLVVILFVGFLLLIVPGLFVLQRYLLSPYAMVKENLGIGAAFKRSAEMAKQNGGAVWGIIGVEFLISIVSIIPILGWIISFVGSIIYSLAPAIRYEQLSNLSGTGPQAAAPSQAL